MHCIIYLKLLDYFNINIVDCFNKLTHKTLNKGDFKMDKINFKENMFNNIASDIINKRIQNKDIQQNKISSKTGFKSIDNCSDSDVLLNEGDICIIAGRPGSGKVALSNNIALNNAKDGKKVLLISCEQSKEAIVESFLANISNIELSCFLRNNVSKTQLDTISKELNNHEYLSNIHIVSEKYLTIFKLIEIIKEYKNKYDIDVVFINYIQLIRLPNGILPSRWEDHYLISNLLSRLINELGLISYISSTVDGKCELRENKMPHPTEIKDLESLRFSSKLILMVCRPGYYTPDKYDSNIIDIDMYLNGGKPCGTINLNLNGPIQKVSEI